MKLSTHTAPSKPLAERQYLSGDQVMKLLGYSDPCSFWQFVRKERVPHIRLNARRFVFESGELDAWLAAHRVA